MTSPVSLAGSTSVPSTEASALLRGLEKPADLNHDGHVSDAEFMKFLNDAVAAADAAHSSSAAPAVTPQGIK